MTGSESPVDGPPSRWRWLAHALWAMPVGYLVYWSFAGLSFDFGHMGQGLVTIRDYVSRMAPHHPSEWTEDRATLPALWEPLGATIQMAIFGTVTGALAAFPMSFLAARTGGIPRPISAAFKTFLNILRAVPTMIYALIVVSGIGLGVTAGAVAISFVTFISLAKMFAEALESVSPGPVEAVRAAGGNPAQVFVFGMMPQVFPIYLSNILYALEYNLKESTIVGIVGAGGLGYELLNDIRLYKLLDVGVILVLIILVVNLVDYLSYRVRLVFS